MGTENFCGNDMGIGVKLWGRGAYRKNRNGVEWGKVVGVWKKIFTVSLSNKKEVHVKWNILIFELELCFLCNVSERHNKCWFYL